MSKKQRRQRRVFTEEFKADAVELVRESGKSASQVAKDLDLTETTLRGWVRKAAGQKQETSLEEGGLVELRRLRDENRVLRMERDFLKKAAAFFAAESK